VFLDERGVNDAAARTDQKLRELSKSSFNINNTVTTAAGRSSTMASPNSPRVAALSRPEPLQEVLAQDKVEDCMPCRITGSMNLFHPTDNFC
jgi:hypothetical protein